MTTTTLPKIDSTHTRAADNTTTILFLLIAIGAAIGLPTYAYFYDYSWLDWTMFGVLFCLSRLGQSDPLDWRGMGAPKLRV